MSDETAPLREHDREQGGKAGHETYATGTRFGRYVILRSVGSGGAGAVYAAFDPHLDRRVALKVLHPRWDDPDRGWDSLLSEARTLARLKHVNVVTVHDVDLHEGKAYVAMELVEGEDLAGWVNRCRPDTAAIVDAYARAGSGLDAAHRQGVVHRDFKPRNVLVSSDGPHLSAVKVGDFGLASAPEGAYPTTDDEGPMSATPDTADTADTDERRNSFGTPAYMAPEQHESEPVDARSDQYAFCVSLWESLTRQRPFTGTLFALAEAKREGPPPWPPHDRTPRWIVAIIGRGLAPQPAARWPSMADLVARLRAGDPRRKWARRAAYASAATGLVGAGVTMGAFGNDTAQARCIGADAEVAAVWSTSRRDAVHAAMGSVASSFSDDTADRVVAGLDAYAVAWSQAHAGTCEATLRAEQSELLLDVRMACLRRQLGGFDALAHVLEAADPDVLANAVSAVFSLPDAMTCRNAEARADAVADPVAPARAQEANAVRDGISRVEAMSLAGRYVEAEAALEPFAARSNVLAHPPVTTEVALARGRLLLQTGAYKDGIAVLETAYTDGLRMGHLAVATEAAVALTAAFVNRFDDHSSALQWARHARPLAERNGLEHQLVIRVRLSVASAHRLAGAFDEAEAELREAQAMMDRTLERGDPMHPSARVGLGHLYWAMGRYEDALAAFDDAKVLTVAALGENHPGVAKRIGDIGTMLSKLERFEEGNKLLREALARAKAALGPDHPDVAVMQGNLAAGLGTVDQIDEAVSLLEESLATKTRVYGPNSLELYRTLVNLGALRKQQRRPDEALELVSRALRVQEDRISSTNPALNATLSNLAAVYLWLGRLDEGSDAYERMLTIADANFEHPHRDFAQAYLGLANLRLGQGRHDDALGYYEKATTEFEGLGPSASARVTMVLAGRALSLEELGRTDEAGRVSLQAVNRGFGGSNMLPWERAMTQLRAGKWLWSSSKTVDDRTRAVELVRAAHEDAALAGDYGTEFGAEARAWLRRRR